MTNHWADIANSTFVLVWGANPAENHPACIAHVNRARFPQQYYTSDYDTAPHRANKTPAKMIVVDPRQTRTALMVDPTRGDRYIRIRPGTDIALQNAVLKYIIDQMESSGGAVSAAAKTAFYSFLNQSGNGTFYTDGDSTHASSSATPVPGCSKYTDARFLVRPDGKDYQRQTIAAATGAPPVGGETANQLITNFPKMVADCRSDSNTVYNRLKSHVSPYTTAVAADICGCSEGDIIFLADAIIENSRCTATAAGATNDPRDPLYRATTILYAMGQTQHTYGSNAIKGFANIQSLMGNMGRAGGGINALRGIHNVQGSTDMGLLFGNIPAYSSNPTWNANSTAFGEYMDGLWGNPLSGTTGTTDFTGTVRSKMDGSFDDSYNTSAMNLQQRGFFNMTLKWFGNYTQAMAATTLAARKALVDAAYSLWPKGSGDDHVTMFRKMATGATTALVCWGQNPAVSEPNQGAIRSGLYNLDLLVCVDMFQNETAAASRKAGAVTFLIPAAAHTEKAGSATNSGRTLQWRYQAAAPAGNSKDDTELLLRFAKALDTAGAFSHIKTVWDANGITYATDVYTQLYGTPYGYAGGSGYASVSGTAEVVTVRKNVTDSLVVNSAATVTGSEWVSELVYREINAPVASGGTIWIYTGAYNAGATWTTDNKAASQAAWAVQNRSKSRDNANYLGQQHFWGWGYSWLVNRRVFYNNSDVLGDVADFFMEPESCAHLFAAKARAAGETDPTVVGDGLLNYSRWYRHNHTLKDVPSPVLLGDTTSPHYAGNSVSLAGRFPGHTEPYETPRQDLLVDWGRNTKGTAGNPWDLVKDDTRVAGRGFVNGVGGKTVTDPPASDFPLVLTTIRCVEHFQGGPISRNNWWNVELEPEPWIELNSSDARTHGLVDGDYVRIVTARMVDDTGATVPLANYGNGFRVRIGAGLTQSQRVAPGVVAIPWHWGEKGLSTGSRANDLCIDATDANSVIPESKACLCRLEKM